MSFQDNNNSPFRIRGIDAQQTKTIIQTTTITHDKQNMHTCQSHQLPNGLRIVHQLSSSPISYCGVAINTGARDETDDEHGMAHFVEHMLFKGTTKRQPHHIAARMENVGGELNAYTTKEETFIYAVFLDEYTARATELLADLMLNSQFPQTQIEKEREVILDEIAIYNDSPSELIYDDFENLLFEKHALGHYILGSSQSLQRFDTQAVQQFVQRQYDPNRMVFFYYGKSPADKIFRLVEKHFEQNNHISHAPIARKAPTRPQTQTQQWTKNTAQTHVMLGNTAYSMFNQNRFALYLLNNILAGGGMKSRLNTLLREKHGLVYSVESTTAFYTDTGIIGIYFGCDAKDADRCIRMTKKELRRIIQTPLTDMQLSLAKKQLKGQMGISAANHENVALQTAKSFLHFGRSTTIESAFAKIDAITAQQLQQVAAEVFDDNMMFEIRYS